VPPTEFEAAVSNMNLCFANIRRPQNLAIKDAMVPMISKATALPEIARGNGLISIKGFMS